MMQKMHSKVHIPALLRAVGVEDIVLLDPFKTQECIEEVESISKRKGVRALVFESPCIKLFRPNSRYEFSNACIGCGKCVRELGCPALIRGEDKKLEIDPALCYSCGICAPICPTSAISEVI